MSDPNQEFEKFKEEFQRLILTCNLLTRQVDRWKGELESLAGVGSEYTFDEIIAILKDRFEEVPFQIRLHRLLQQEDFPIDRYYHVATELQVAPTTVARWLGGVAEPGKASQEEILRKIARIVSSWSDVKQQPS